MRKLLKSGVRDLSDRARPWLHRLLDEQRTADSVAHELFLRTGETLPPEVITRYASRYGKQKQKQQRLRETVDGFIARAREQGITVSDLLRAALLEKFSLAERDGSLKKLGLLELEAADRKRGEFELKRKQAQLSAEYKQRELQIKERQAALAERRFHLEREKAKTDFQKLERKAAAGRPLSRDDLRKIKEIYGIYDDAPNAETLHETA